MKKIIIALVLFGALFTKTASAQTIPTPPPDISKIVDRIAASYSVATSTINAVLFYESTYCTNMVGDYGESFGCAQIHLIDHPDISYAQAMDPAFSIDYLGKQISLGKGRMWTGYRRWQLSTTIPL